MQTLCAILLQLWLIVQINQFNGPYIFEFSSNIWHVLGQFVESRIVDFAHEIEAFDVSEDESVEVFADQTLA